LKQSVDRHAAAAVVAGRRQNLTLRAGPAEDHRTVDGGVGLRGSDAHSSESAQGDDPGENESLHVYISYLRRFYGRKPYARTSDEEADVKG
jgi:hypothetical protein